MRFFLIGSLLTFSVCGETNTSLSGAVLDAGGVAVEAATVRARNTQTGATSSAVTGRDGKYTVGNLTPGNYDVSITGVPAMSNFEQKNVAIDSKPAVLDIRMDFNTQLGTLGEDRVNLAADARRHKPPSGPAPRTKDSKPDLSGVWWRPTDVDGGGPQFFPAADAVARDRREANTKDNPQVRCLPEQCSASALFSKWSKARTT